MLGDKTRKVLVSATIDYVVEVPQDWDADMIEFHRNDGSWCTSNGIAEIVDLDERLADADSCTCNIVKYRYVREASIEDLEASALPLPMPKD